MTPPETPRCHDCPNPSDPDYTERFDDIGQPPIFFCKGCHTRAMDLWKPIQEALDSGKISLEQVKNALDVVQARNHGPGGTCPDGSDN